MDKIIETLPEIKCLFEAIDRRERELFNKYPELALLTGAVARAARKAISFRARNLNGLLPDKIAPTLPHYNRRIDVLAAQLPPLPTERQALYETLCPRDEIVFSLISSMGTLKAEYRPGLQGPCFKAACQAMWAWGGRWANQAHSVGQILLVAADRALGPD